MRLRVLGSLVFLAILNSCSSDSTDSAAAPAAVPDPVADVAAVYASVTGSLNILHVTSYGAELKLDDESWTSDDWETETRFNCPDDQCEGSMTAKAAIDAQLDSDRGGVIGTIKRKLDVFCYVGAMIPAEDMGSDNLPKVAEEHAVTIDEAVIAKLIDDCGMAEEEAQGLTEETINLVVEAVEGGVYDRYINFIAGSGDEVEENPFYIKNSDGIIRVAMYEGSTDDGHGNSGISRVLFSKDLADDIFQFEYFARIEATGDSIEDGGSMTFSRGYANGTTKEIAFITDFGNENTAINHSFMSMSSNLDEAEAGAYFSRTAEDATVLTGAFVCFETADGSFVNNTGCTENSAEDRVRVWSPTVDLFETIVASTQESWELSETTVVKDFDTTTILTLAP